MPSSSAPDTETRRTPDPVAISALSKLTSCPLDSDTVRSPMSRLLAETRVSASICCSSYQSAGRNSVSSRDSLSWR